MSVLVEHMSTNGDHLSAESLEWSAVLLFRTHHSPYVTPAFEVILMLLLPPLLRWGLKCPYTSLPNLLPKPNH
jgi:hypothetical protein